MTTVQVTLPPKTDLKWASDYPKQEPQSLQWEDQYAYSRVISSKVQFGRNMIVVKWVADIKGWAAWSSPDVLVRDTLYADTIEFAKQEAVDLFRLRCLDIARTIEKLP